MSWIPPLVDTLRRISSAPPKTTYPSRPAAVFVRAACGDAADEIMRLRQVIGAHVEADAYRDTMPDDEMDAAQLREGESFWRAKAAEWAGEATLRECEEAAAERQRNDPAVVAEMRAIHAELMDMLVAKKQSK